MDKQHLSFRERGQALVEFALILPIVLFLIFAILDFGRLLLAYTSASNSLREAARYATTVGQVGTRRYLDCAGGIDSTARNVYFVNNQNITVEYLPYDDLLNPIACGAITDAALENGDLLRITSENTVNLITPFLSGIWPSIRLDFVAQRTIVKEIELQTSVGDAEPDGLDDAWEQFWFDDPSDPNDDPLRYTSTDDPDGDGCNNGCEELFPADVANGIPIALDPLNPDSDGDSLPGCDLNDGNELFIYGTDPRLTDTDGDTFTDSEEICVNGTDPLTFEPFARDDNQIATTYDWMDIYILNNDTAQVSTEIYIIDPDPASLSPWPTTQGGEIRLVDNGATGLGSGSDDYFEYRPRPGFSGTDTFTYTITDSSGIPSTATVTITVNAGIATPVPTATPGPYVYTESDFPADTNFADPIDYANEDQWRLDRGQVFMGYDDWEVEWYDGISTPVDGTDPVLTTITCTTTQPYDEPIAFAWGTGAPAGACVGADNFGARWQRTFHLDAATNVTIDVMADNMVQVLVDGSGEINHWGPGPAGGGLFEGSATVSLAAGEHTLVVRYAEYSGDATLIVNIHYPNYNDDRGICGWAMDGSDGFGSAPAWTDYPNRDYYDRSRCSLELRDAVDLTGLANPELTFYDKWNLADANDTAWVQVRAYDPAQYTPLGGPTAPWFGQQLHAGTDAETAWTRQAIRLDHFDAINMNTGTAAGTLDFTGDTVEIRFTIIGGDDAGVQSGWWVDEVRVEEGTPSILTIPWTDNVDGGNLYWQPSGSWAISGEKTHSGAGAWSDSPGGPYMPTADYILELDGLVDVIGSTDPLLIFYHAWNLGAGDSLYVEYTTDNGATWAPIGGAAITTATTNTALVRQEVSLNAIKGTQFGLRFRLHADGDGLQGDGWYIDDIELAERDTGLVALPFYDDANSATSTYWYPDGTWAMAAEANHGSAVGSAWSDSPGANYLHQSSSSLRSQQRFDISGLTNPELSFWYRRDLAATDGLFVEVSTDYGATWSTVWSRSYCGSGNATETAPDSNGNPVSCTLFNQQLGWERISLNMGAYAATPFYLRFRVDAMNDAGVASGVWIDDIRLAGYTETPHTVPFADDMEDAANWYLGGDWDTTLSEQHAGASSMTDSPSTNYTTSTWAILQLKQPISLAGIIADDYPILTWWDRYGLAQYDYARVQVSQWNGPGWNDWGAWQELEQHYFNTNTAWNRQQVDLSAYAGQKIRLRFVLDALNLPDVADGWYIDDVAVSLYAPTGLSVPFTEDADSLTGWLAGGTWNTSGVARGAGTSGLSAGTWTATFYDLTDAACTGTDAERAEDAILNNCAPASTSASIGDVQFLCAAGQSPDPSGSCVADASAWRSEHFGARFVRTFTVTEAGQYGFTLTYNDGMQLFVYPASGSRAAPTLSVNRWYDNSTTPLPETFSGDLAAGDYIVEVWYYENTGDAVIALDIDRPSKSFYARSEDVYDDMLLTLDELIDLDGVTTPALSWYDQYELANTESCVVVEVALPYYRTDRWATAYGPFCGSDTSSGAWQTHTVPNLRTVLQTLEDVANHGTLTISGDNALMALRFRLYADMAGNEWWVEDIAITG